jgi:hypothetical protein
MKAGILFITVVFLAGFTAFAQTRSVMAGQNEDAGASQQNKKDAQKQDDQKQYLYQWIDGKGVVHVTDNLNKVPKQYRSNARRMESAPGELENQSEPKPQVRTAPPNYQDKEEQEAEQKDEWLERMRAAKRKLANAEKHYQELEKKRDAAIMSWGGPSSGRLEGREEAARIEEEMKQVRQEIEDARNDIDVRIPDAARKAGIPPGWLRE